MKGFLIHNVVSMRAEPDSRSEQVSQGIMGDSVTILENGETYSYVKTWDDYEGWMLRSQIRVCDPGQEFDAPRFEARLKRMLDPLTGVRSELSIEEGVLTLLPFWTPYYEVDGEANEHKILLPDSSYGYLKEPNSSRIQSHRRDVRLASVLAGQFVGVPYLWGGSTPFGFDCSGFVQALYRAIGVALPRDAYLQADSPLGTRLSESETTVAGDLVFFLGQKDPRNRGVTHVGIALNDLKFIHAYGKTGVILSAFNDLEIKNSYEFKGSWRLNVLNERQTE